MARLALFLLFGVVVSVSARAQGGAAFGCELDLEFHGGRSLSHSDLVGLAPHLRTLFGVDIQIVPEDGVAIRSRRDADDNLILTVPYGLIGLNLWHEFVQVYQRLKRVRYLQDSGVDLFVQRIGSRELVSEVVRIRKNASPPFRALRIAMDRYKIAVLFNDQVFTGRLKDADAFASGSEIYFQPRLIGRPELESASAHELIHAINFVIWARGGTPEKLIQFEAVDGRRFPRLTGSYGESFRSDEIEAWYFDGLVSGDKGITSKSMRFSLQLEWLKLVEKEIKKRNSEWPKWESELSFKKRSEYLVRDRDLPVRVLIRLTENDRPLDIVQKRIAQLEAFLDERVAEFRSATEVDPSLKVFKALVRD